MTLTDYLRLPFFQGKPCIAFVGGGGKTSAMFTLATELAGRGLRVVTTTTTRLYASQRAQSKAWCGADELEKLSDLLAQYGQCLVTAPDSAWEDGKAKGVAPSVIGELLAREAVDVVLNEADGSRARPFKAPAPHEPVIPPQTTHVIALVGADVFGKPLTADNVHRPERVAALADIQAGNSITPEVVATVLTHPDGGLQYVPPNVLFIPFLNKVEDHQRLALASRTAELLLREGRVTEVLSGSLHGLKADRENSLRRHTRGVGVVLAAGMARRFGRTKQLLEWEGEPLVVRAAHNLLEVCDPVIVVVGHDAAAVTTALGGLPVEIIVNPDYEQGQGTSIAAAARALLKPGRPFYGDILITVADQPLMTADILRQLREIRGPALLANCRYQQQTASPAIFDAALLPELAKLRGDEGGRNLFRKYKAQATSLELNSPLPLQDVDDEKSWELLEKMQESA